MTLQRVVERVMPHDAFEVCPVVGEYLLSPTGASLYSVTKVRRVMATSGDKLRLFLLRVRHRDAPPGITPTPWPKQAQRRRSPSTGPAAPPTDQARVTPAQLRVAQRKHVVALLRDDRDSNRVVHGARLLNGTAVSGSWRDPEDLNVQRRTARQISGYRAPDVIENMLAQGSLNKSQARAARRFRKEYELGPVGLRPTKNLLEAPTGFTSSDGPSENRMIALQTYNATVAALGRHMTEVLVAVVIGSQTLASYAKTRRMSAPQVSGYVLAAIERLSDHFKKVDDEDQKASEA